MDATSVLQENQRKDLLRFVTAGSVDDGKSTLIGRLLYESKGIYEDQLDSIRSASGRRGSSLDELDLALVTDGLRAEREQGITIDVAYRYFSTPRRKFIIADTPGHEQYTRNMATGASTASLMVILLDASQGVLTQSKRHLFIASLLGIPHVVVAVNKMDLVDWSQRVFEDIRAEFTDFAARLAVRDLNFIPLSALKGDNVVTPSTNMPWYRGGPLLNYLESVHIASDRNLIDTRFPVQYVLRPNSRFRGYLGTVASGVLRPGEEIMVLPSGHRSRIRTVFGGDGDLEEAFPPMSVGITLEDEIDISRGDMIVRRHNVPRVDHRFDAMLVWMVDEPMQPGRPYLVKHTTRTVPGIVSALRYRVDVNTLHRRPAPGLGLNEIGRVELTLNQAVPHDPYSKNRTTGAFIVIDRLSGATVGAGVILDREPGELAPATPRRTAVPRSDVAVRPDERAARLRQQPATVWLTGLTGAGKSRVAAALERRLFDAGHYAALLDASNVRLGVADDPAAENLWRVAEAACALNEAGLLAVADFVSAYAEDRRLARKTIGPDRFVEVYLDAPEDVRRARTASAAAPAARADLLAAVVAPYEPPPAPDLTLHTGELTVDECVDRIIDLLRTRGLILEEHAES